MAEQDPVKSKILKTFAPVNVDELIIRYGIYTRDVLVAKYKSSFPGVKPRDLARMSRENIFRGLAEYHGIEVTDDILVKTRMTKEDIAILLYDNFDSFIENRIISELTTK